MSLEIDKIAVLEFIQARMHGEPGYAFIDPTIGRELVAAGLIELNETIIDDYGALAARLTPSGIWEVENASGPAQIEASADILNDRLNRLTKLKGTRTYGYQECTRSRCCYWL